MAVGTGEVTCGWFDRTDAQVSMNRNYSRNMLNSSGRQTTGTSCRAVETSPLIR